MNASMKGSKKTKKPGKTVVPAPGSSAAAALAASQGKVIVPLRNMVVQEEVCEQWFRYLFNDQSNSLRFPKKLLYKDHSYLLPMG